MTIYRSQTHPHLRIKAIKAHQPSTHTKVNHLHVCQQFLNYWWFNKEVIPWSSITSLDMSVKKTWHLIHILFGFTFSRGVVINMHYVFITYPTLLYYTIVFYFRDSSESVALFLDSIWVSFSPRNCTFLLMYSLSCWPTFVVICWTLNLILSDLCWCKYLYVNARSNFRKQRNDGNTKWQWKCHSYKSMVNENILYNLNK